MIDTGGRIITFYSYKGGVGRTLALANVAWILASNGRRVLVIDWDLEAPGLQRFFRPFLDESAAASPGLIDLLHEQNLLSANASLYPDASGSTPTSVDILPYLQSVAWSFPQPGYLDLMTAGRQDPSYSVRVSTFDWETFYSKLGGAAFFDGLRARLREDYDYVLIDSRTGLGDTAGICTVKLPDQLVVCFTMNRQSIDGGAATARGVLDQRQGQPIRILPVPMRLERGEQTLLNQAFAVVEQTFDPMMTDLDAAERQRYWQEVAFFYSPYYSYGELLAVFGDAHRQSDSMLASAERLTAHLSGGEVTAAAPISEDQRRDVLARYSRSS
jgi:hypothetical protein